VDPEAWGDPDAQKSSITQVQPDSLFSAPSVLASGRPRPCLSSRALRRAYYPDLVLPAFISPFSNVASDASMWCLRGARPDIGAALYVDMSM
jgi:hypothetical protein